MSDGALLAAATVESGAGLAQSIRTGKHTFASDEPVALGGTDTGPAPYQLLTGALGACTSITLKMYAEKKKWDLGTLTVRIKAFKNDDGTTRFERTLESSVALTGEQRAKLLEIAGKTPVTMTLLQGSKIDTKFE